MDQIRPEIRTFVLGTIGLSTATWNVAFNLGAYRTIFYGNIFAVWVTVTAILLVVLLVPERDVPVPWWGKLLMLVPTVGVALVPINSINNEGEVTNWFTIGLGLIAILVCLPYAIYVVVNVINADLLNLPETRLKIYLVMIVLVVGLMGYWAGANNHVFLTCGDFKIAGADMPANCRPGPPAQF
jgi:hypothetical protein